VTSNQASPTRPPRSNAGPEARCSVCIPTYRRPWELTMCLEALKRQTEPPDEIIVSDAGGDAETPRVVRACAEGRPWTVRHCPTPRSGLPWQRWWAYQHSHGSPESLVFFLDDDVRLAPDALATIRAAYRRQPDLAGAGFAITFGDSGANSSSTDTSTTTPTPTRALRERDTPTTTLRERWLGIAGARPGTITAGGLTIIQPVPGVDRRSIEVDWLSGGAMSFRRSVLDAVGPLDRLYALYDERIGVAEDSILCSRAHRHGRLLLIVGPYAWHPPIEHATRTESPTDGYLKGLLETWGRAHVVRWLASDRRASGRAWVRLASLELARAAKAALEHPLAPSRWQRIAGGLVGIQRTIRRWDRIPAHAGCRSIERSQREGDSHEHESQRA
jgi:GT2 family glycosyltransferase